MAFENRYTSQLNPEISIEVAFAYNDEPYIVFSAKTSNNIYVEGRWDFDVDKKSMQFSTLMHMSAQATCIATCLGTSIGGALLECLLKSRSLIEIGNCLSGKTLGAYSGSIVCIGLCLGLT